MSTRVEVKDSTLGSESYFLNASRHTLSIPPVKLKGAHNIASPVKFVEALLRATAHATIQPEMLLEDDGVVCSRFATVHYGKRVNQAGATKGGLKKIAAAFQVHEYGGG